MKEYHKIQTVFLRDPATGFKTLLDGQYAKPEFEYLKDCRWMFTEKVDGTNVRVMWDGAKVLFGGKTDDAQMPVFLSRYLADTFATDKMLAAFDCGEVCLYGEGYGAKIQKGGGNYIPNGCGFILFDVNIGGVWLERANVEDIAHKLGIGVVPIVFEGTLTDGITMARQGYASSVAAVSGTKAEGLVMRPAVELVNRRGERVISKIKHKDFR